MIIKRWLEKYPDCEDIFHRADYYSIVVAFKLQRRASNKRNIPFLLTLREWWDIWCTSAHWDERGVGRGKYVMARKGPDIGPYEKSNILIQLCEKNSSDANRGREPWNKGTVGLQKMSEESRLRMIEKLSGRKRPPRDWKWRMNHQSTIAIKNQKAEEICYR